MLIQMMDLNGAAAVISAYYKAQWEELVEVLTEMPLHLKASDQAGIQGTLIFDPVGTNEFIKGRLESLGWKAKIPIPKEYGFFGTDVDFGKGGVIAEVQFSNYPFLLNNAIRSAIFFKEKTIFEGHPAGVVIIVTKARMIRASNSTLYYEQGCKQLAELVKNKILDIPIRLVGLFERESGAIPFTFTSYTSARYSRKVLRRYTRECEIIPSRNPNGRCKIIMTEPPPSP